MYYFYLIFLLVLPCGHTSFLAYSNICLESSWIYWLLIHVNTTVTVSLTLCLFLTGKSRLMLRCWTSRKHSMLYHIGGYSENFVTVALTGSRWHGLRVFWAVDLKGSSWMVFALLGHQSSTRDCTWSVTFPHLYKWLTWLRHEQSSTFCRWLFDIGLPWNT